MKVMENASNLHIATERRFKSFLHSYQINSNMPAIADPRLDRPGVEKMGDVVSLLVGTATTTPEEITVIAPLIYRLCGLVRRLDACFCIMHDALKSRDWYVDPSIHEYRVKMIVFRELIRQSMPMTFSSLASFHGLADVHLHKIFVGYFFDVLSPTHATRIFDSFMIEGEKVLMRFGYALLAMFKKEIKEMKFPDGAAFWEYLKRRSVDVDFDELSNLAYERHKSSLDKLRKPTIFSRHYISGVREEARGVIAVDRTNSSKLQQRDLDTLFADIAFEAVVSTWFDNSMLKQSRLLNLHTAVRLHSYLKTAQCAPSEFSLAYSSARDGASLSSLYASVARKGPSVLLVRSLNTESVIGVFLPGCIGPPNGRIISDAECFVFRLDGKSAAKYKPSPASPQTSPDKGSMQQQQQSKDSPARFDPAGFTRMYKAQFSQAVMTFGSSAQRIPTNALKLTSDLGMAYTGPSDTYQNPSLLPEEPSPFPVDLIEVFCGKRTFSGDDEADQGGENEGDVKFLPLTMEVLGAVPSVEASPTQNEGEEGEESAAVLRTRYAEKFKLRQKPNGEWADESDGDDVLCGGIEIPDVTMESETETVVLSVKDPIGYMSMLETMERDMSTWCLSMSEAVPMRELQETYRTIKQNLKVVEKIQSDLEEQDLDSQVENSSLCSLLKKVSELIEKLTTVKNEFKQDIYREYKERRKRYAEQANERARREEQRAAERLEAQQQQRSELLRQARAKILSEFSGGPKHSSSLVAPESIQNTPPQVTRLEPLEINESRDEGDENEEEEGFNYGQASETASLASEGDDSARLRSILDSTDDLDLGEKKAEYIDERQDKINHQLAAEVSRALRRSDLNKASSRSVDPDDHKDVAKAEGVPGNFSSHSPLRMDAADDVEELHSADEEEEEAGDSPRAAAIYSPSYRRPFRRLNIDENVDNELAEEADFETEFSM